MNLKSLELSGFKSFAKKTDLEFSSAITSIVGPNGSGKSNVAEAFRFVLGEQSIKSMRGKRGEDLIFNGSGSASRMNRASVKVVFDNREVKKADGTSGRLLAIDFDEVSIERAVHRDGENEYIINGSKVRLRDVIELLSGANIGASGHHIISQGEADRVLSANPKERRAMIEDALGLRIYQYKREESIKKLEKTEENRKQVEALRKENAPHLRFLERQVEKLQKAVLLREELVTTYQEYLKREEIYITNAAEILSVEAEGPEHEMRELENRLHEAKRVLQESEGHDAKSDAVLSIENDLRDARHAKDTLTRDLGRLEGEIVAEERRVEREEKAREMGKDISVPLHVVQSFADDLEVELHASKKGETMAHIHSAIDSILNRLKDFILHIGSRGEEHSVEESKNLIATLREKHAAISGAITEAEREEQKLEARYLELKSEIESKKDQGRESERALFEIMARQSEVRTILQSIEMRRHDLGRLKEAFEHELREAGALIGIDAAHYKKIPIVDRHGAEIPIADILREERSEQDDRRRLLEKMKIRLEELGGAAADDIMREYTEVKERDLFLTRELSDLERSSETLHNLIVELEEKLNIEFQMGIDKISKEFGNFFELMFGGGTAKLVLVEEEKRKKTSTNILSLDSESDEIPENTDIEEGVDVSVNLPNKRIRGLAMLSGGERALTSIALIFAMSQVNPPPFLILDETDAALDEANSRRYGDMIENLGRKSQLIVITHNRETMSRAGVLYGVTMGSDAISKLLSVKFEEAVVVAK